METTKNSSSMGWSQLEARRRAVCCREQSQRSDPSPLEKPEDDEWVPDIRHYIVYTFPFPLFNLKGFRNLGLGTMILRNFYLFASQ